MKPNQDLTYINFKPTLDTDINKLAEDYLIKQKWFCRKPRSTKY